MGTYFEEGGSYDPQKSQNINLQAFQLNEREWKVIQELRMTEWNDNGSAQRIGMKPNDGIMQDVHPLESNKNVPEIYEKTAHKRSIIPENATIEVLVNAISVNPVHLQKDLLSSIISGIKSERKEATLTEAFGKMKDDLKCPFCNGRVKKLSGKQTENLKCDKHGKLDKFALGSQIPKEILTEYFGKIGRDQYDEWIADTNNGINNQIGEDSMDIFEGNQNVSSPLTPLKTNITKNENPKNNEKHKNEKKIETENENQKEIENPVNENKSENKNNNNIQDEIAKMIGSYGEEIFLPETEVSTGMRSSFTTLEKIAIGKPLKEVIKHILNVNGLIAERLQIKGYSQNDGQTFTQDKDVDTPQRVAYKRPRSYIDALEDGIKKNELSGNDIRKVCSYTYNPRFIEAFKTVHFRGIKRSPYSIIKKIFSNLGINKKKIRLLQFVNGDTLEIDMCESYVTELTDILESAHKKQLYKDLVIKRVQFNVLDPENIKNKNITYSAEEIFKYRMQKKLETINKMKLMAPHLIRLENYVKKQIRYNSLDIPLGTPLNYNDTVAAHIDEQLSKQLSTRKETYDSVEIQTEEIMKPEEMQAEVMMKTEEMQTEDMKTEKNVTMNPEETLYDTTMEFENASMVTEINMNE